MKNKIKFLALFLIGNLVITSCSKDDDGEIINDFIENINESYFSNFELGNAAFIVPQSNVDMHINFDYEGKSKISKVYFDVTGSNLEPLKDNEANWEVSKHLVNTEYYEGKINANIHYHLFFDEENKYDPSTIPAEGTYFFKATIIHEDESKSVVTKEFKIINKFIDLKVGDNNTINQGDTEIHTKFKYNSGTNTVAAIKLILWFKEWRDNQNVEVGLWDNTTTEVPEEQFKNIKNPTIDYNIALPENLPAGQYYVSIEVNETGNNEAISTLLLITVK